MINLNNLAKDITLAEGQKISLPIGQVKEVLKITLQLLAKEKPSQVLYLLEKMSMRKG